MGIENGAKFAEGKEINANDKMEVLEAQGIVAFDVGLTPEEKRSIAEVNIEKRLPPFDYYGPVNEDLVKILTAYFSELGENSEEVVTDISKLVTRVAETTIQDFDKESAWVTVRVSLPDDGFNVPRWHADGAYFKPAGAKDKTYKLVMTLKGAQTRFGEKTDAEKFEQLMAESSKNDELNGGDAEIFEQEDIRIRKELDSIIRETHPVKDGEAVYFLVGDENAKIHSEPPIGSPRIFMSVVAGSSDQVDGLKAR